MYSAPTTRSDFQWWTKDENPHERMVACAQFLESQDETRKNAILDYMRLYGNVDVLGYDAANYFRVSNPDRVTLNVIKAASDAVTAKIAKNKPRPMFLTEGGDYGLRKKAKQLEKFIDGQFYLMGMYKIGPKVFLDACVFGTGILKVYREDKTIRCERIFPGEIFVDHAEALYGEPRQLFQRKYVARELLLELYPDKKVELSRAQGPSDSDFGVDSAADQITVYEAWHLPSSEDAEDGRHLICVDNCTLLDEPWEEPNFPFIFIRWGEPLRGFWGQGLAEELIGIQVEINRLLLKIQKAFALLAQPRVFVNQASQIQKTYINNMIGAIVPYKGDPPIIATPQTVHPEIFDHLERLYARAFEIAGISQMSAIGSMPVGIDRASGKALNTYHDIDTERFAVIGQAYEEFYLDVAKNVVSIAREISMENRGFEIVTQKDKYFIEKIDWKNIDLKKDAYVIKVFPTSILPSLPAGKLAFVKELQEMGAVTPERGKKLMNFPDLDEEFALDQAAEDDIDAMIENIVDNGEYEAPEPYQDLQLLLKKFQAARLRYRRMGLEEEKLQMMSDVMDTAYEFINRTMQNAAAPTGVPIPGSQPPIGSEGASPMAAQPPGPAQPAAPGQI